MKNILKYFLFVLIIGLGACTDDFLESEPTEFISTDRMVELGDQNPEIFNGTIRGLYTLMYQTRTGGSSETKPDHDDYGQKGYDIYSDLLSSDMVLGGYNYYWYKGIATMATTVDYRDIGNFRVWRYYYRIIRAANTIIDGLGGNDAVLQSDNTKWQMGQAKTMRAYSYFYLVNLYTNEYNESEPALPLYTSLEEKNLPLSTVAEVWATIKSDLEVSVILLDGYSREGLHGINTDVAKGLLAYTYLTMGEYEKAATTAQEVINSGYTIVPLDKVAGGSAIPRNAFSYYDGDGADWIWGMDLTLDQGLDVISWWGHMDFYTYSYAWAGDPKTIDVGLFNSILDTDVRKYQFSVNLNGAVEPLNKFYHEARIGGKQREITADYVYMRVEEMYLIKAEAEAFVNKDVDSKTTLKLLVSERNSDLSFIDALSGQDLKDEIYKQWRVEMWGEGKSYLAMKRNGATIVREGHIDFDGVPIPYNDDRLSFNIPYQEVQDNPNINK